MVQRTYSLQSGGRSASSQRGYQDEVIAREIATSAFNYGMGIVRSQLDVHKGLDMLNGASGAGKSGTYTADRFAGGSYTVKGISTGGFSARLSATGRFGSASYTMTDDYSTPVLYVTEAGVVNVRVLRTSTSSCTGIYLKTYPPGSDPATYTPVPVMTHRQIICEDRVYTRSSHMIWAEVGTQLAFFIGSDYDCSSRAPAATECADRNLTRNSAPPMSVYNTINQAVEFDLGADFHPVKSGLYTWIEASPTRPQTWRVAWEDYMIYDRPSSTDPRNSMQALKKYGYFGNGWPDVDSLGYRLLVNRPGAADMDDQVIEVSVTPPSDPAFTPTVNAYRMLQDSCGEPRDY